MTRGSRCFLVLFVWIIAMGVAACLDRAVALWMRDHGFDVWFRSHRLAAEILKSPGTFYFTAVLAVAVALRHPLRWRAGVFLVLCAAICGLGRLIEWMVGRVRPFKLEIFDASGRPEALPFKLNPFIGGVDGLFHSTNLCFPSGHATLAFATAASLAMLWPRSKWRWAAYGVALVVAVQRIMETAHWVSDTVGALALGVGGVLLIRWIITSWTRDDIVMTGTRDP